MLRGELQFGYCIFFLIWVDFIWFNMSLYEFIWVYMSWYELVWVYMSWCEFIWVYMILYDFIWFYMILFNFIWFYFGELEVARGEAERQGSRATEATVASVEVKVEYVIFDLILYDFDFILFQGAVGCRRRWGGKAAGWRNGGRRLNIWYYFFGSQNISLPSFRSTIAPAASSSLK